MIVSVPASAAAAPPEIPASTNATSRSASAAWIRTVEAGAAVLRSTITWPGRALASSPPSPSTTSSTTVLSGSERNTRSQRAATPAIESAPGTPAAATCSGLRS